VAKNRNTKGGVT